MNLLDILRQFRPIHESFYEAIGFSYGATELRMTCRIAARLFVPPIKVSSDTLCSSAIARGNMPAFEIALEHGAKSYGTLLLQSAYRGSLTMCERLMGIIKANNIIHIIHSFGPITLSLHPADIMLGGAASGDRIGLCGMAIGLGASNYDVMLYFAATYGRKNAMTFARASGAHANFAIYGAAVNHRADTLRDAYEFEDDERAKPTDVMDCVFLWPHNYELQRERDAFIATIRAIRHDSTSIRREHLDKCSKDPRDPRCVAMFELACAHDCPCASCAKDSDFAPFVNCAEIWQVALDHGKVTPDRILKVAIRAQSLEMCRFAIEHGASARAIERMLAKGALSGRRDMCELARECGARDFRAMFASASRNLATKMCRLAIAWSREPGQVAIDVDYMLRSGAYEGDEHKCTMALKCGARNVYEAREIALQCDNRQVARLLLYALRSRDCQPSLDMDPKRKRFHFFGRKSDSDGNSSESSDSDDDPASRP